MIRHHCSTVVFMGQIFTATSIMEYHSLNIDLITATYILFMRALMPLLLVILATLTNAEQLYRKIVHQIDPQAKCLDGSPTAMYLHEGNPRKILFYLQGGATCGGSSYSQTLQNCLQRSKGHLGSSLYWPQTMSGEGILSRDPKKNFLADWTKVVMIYCDGAYHQGYAKDSFKFRGAEIFFRGARNTRSHFAYIDQRFNLSNTEKVILTGSSAGGIATYLWTDYLASLLKPSTQYYPIPDSSIFLPFPTPTQPSQSTTATPDLKTMMSFSDGPESFYNICNKDEPLPNSECVKDNPLAPWNCVALPLALRYLKTQSLFLQSSYDSYIILYMMQLNCPSSGISGFTLQHCDLADLAYIESYRSIYMDFIPSLLEKGHNIWTISCSWHAMAYIDSFYQSPLQKVPQGGNSMQSAVEAFVMKGEKVVDIDVEAWPANIACAK